MTNIKLLNLKIEQSGLKQNYIAKKMNISPQSLYNKTKGLRDFTVDEMQKISFILNLSDKDNKKIFFTKKVDELSTK